MRSRQYMLIYRMSARRAHASFNRWASSGVTPHEIALFLNALSRRGHPVEDVTFLMVTLIEGNTLSREGKQNILDYVPRDLVVSTAEHPDTSMAFKVEFILAPHYGNSGEVLALLQDPTVLDRLTNDEFKLLTFHANRRVRSVGFRFASLTPDDITVAMGRYLIEDTIRDILLYQKKNLTFAHCLTIMNVLGRMILLAAEHDLPEEAYLYIAYHGRDVARTILMNNSSVSEEVRIVAALKSEKVPTRS